MSVSSRQVLWWVMLHTISLQPVPNKQKSLCVHFPQLIHGTAHQHVRNQAAQSPTAAPVQTATREACCCSLDVLHAYSQAA